VVGVGVSDVELSHPVVVMKNPMTITSIQYRVTHDMPLLVLVVVNRV